MKTIFERSSPKRSATTLPDIKTKDWLTADVLRDEIDLPEIAEIDIIRHYTGLSKKNFGVDNGFYPLGSCTMKYNPKMNEDIAGLDGFLKAHPLLPKNCLQGTIQVIYEMQELLKEVVGMAGFTLQPAAGAHGELTSVMIMKQYFKDRGENRKKILIPDSAHGTNPASAAHCGFDCIEIKSDAKGNVDMDALREILNPDVAGMMMTYPNTLGLFDENIVKVADLLHENGSLLYIDGANFNAMMGIVRPGDLGADLIHLNLHKSFSTPHGGGGPGSGPVGVCKKLVKYLPSSQARMVDGEYSFVEPESTIGPVKAFYGNFGVIVKAYAYILSLGQEGLRKTSQSAVLNANYLKNRLKKSYHLAYDRICAHEFVLSDKDMPNGVTTNHIANRILDYGMHAPTIYFPLNVHGAIMIEPTETESVETLDLFAEVMENIKKEAKTDPEMVKHAPYTLPIKLLDGVKAARHPNLKYCQTCLK